MVAWDGEERKTRVTVRSWRILLVLRQSSQMAGGSCILKLPHTDDQRIQRIGSVVLNVPWNYCGRQCPVVELSVLFLNSMINTKARTSALLDLIERTIIYIK